MFLFPREASVPSRMDARASAPAGAQRRNSSAIFKLRSEDESGYGAIVDRNGLSRFGGIESASGTLVAVKLLVGHDYQRLAAWLTTLADGHPAADA